MGPGRPNHDDPRWSCQANRLVDREVVVEGLEANLLAGQLETRRWDVDSHGSGVAIGFGAYDA